tara:strand:+ start:1825 stop:2043 length:219 start_codon:yes stop_codon:yes gene_type:complete
MTTGSVTQHQIEVINGDLDEIYSKVESMIKQLKYNTRVINDMMEAIASAQKVAPITLFCDYPVKNYMRRERI